MTVSLVLYQLLIAYLLFNEEVSKAVPALKAFDENVMQFFGVDSSDQLLHFSPAVKLLIAAALLSASVVSVAGELLLLRLFREKRD